MKWDNDTPTPQKYLVEMRGTNYDRHTTTTSLIIGCCSRRDSASFREQLVRRRIRARGTTWASTRGYKLTGWHHTSLASSHPAPVLGSNCVGSDVRRRDGWCQLFRLVDGPQERLLTPGVRMTRELLQGRKRREKSKSWSFPNTSVRLIWIEIPVLKFLLAINALDSWTLRWKLQLTSKSALLGWPQVMLLWQLKRNDANQLCLEYNIDQTHDKCKGEILYLIQAGSLKYPKYSISSKIPASLF